MIHPHEIEEGSFFWSRADRFDGFDRGDNGRAELDIPDVRVIARESCVSGRLILEEIRDGDCTEYALYFSHDKWGSLYYGEDESQARLIAAWWLAGAHA